MQFQSLKYFAKDLGKMRAGMQTDEFLAPNTQVFWNARALTELIMNLLVVLHVKPFVTKILLFYFQYIFGEFSPDEFNQFFVTPRCSVEVRSTLTFFYKVHINAPSLCVYLKQSTTVTTLSFFQLVN